MFAVAAGAITLGNVVMTFGFLKLIWVSDAGIAGGGSRVDTRTLPGLLWVAIGVALCCLPLGLQGWG